jgi:hypothetical protein
VPVDSAKDLYGLPLDRFIPERAALAKALRGAKQREEAGEVGALRKPSVAAWAVNQLVRTQPKGIQILFGAGDDLAQAQADAAAGQRSGDAMRDATRRQRDAVSQLLQAAEGLLSSEGQALSQTTLERVGDTLRAAAVDEEARRQVEGGCLTHELRFVGLGLGGLAASPGTSPPAPARDKAAPGRTGEPKNKKTAARRAQEKAEATRETEATREAERERAAALKAARRAEADARRSATRAEKELAAAQARRVQAASSLEEAERILRAAEERAEETAAALESAERSLNDLAEA